MKIALNQSITFIKVLSNGELYVTVYIHSC